MSMLSVRQCFRVMSKYLPLVAQNKSRRARLAFPGTPSIPLFRAFHSRQFPSCSYIYIYIKRIVENNCYCDAQCDSRRQEISAPTAHYSRSVETEFETTPWRLSRWIIPRLPRNVPMDEELKYKRYRENITNSVFSDGAFRSNLSTDGAASNIIEMAFPAKKLYQFLRELDHSHRRVIVTKRYIWVNFAYK